MINLNNITNNLHKNLILTNQGSTEFFGSNSSQNRDHRELALILFERFQADVRFLKALTIASSSRLQMEIECIPITIDVLFRHISIKVYAEEGRWLAEKVHSVY